MQQKALHLMIGLLLGNLTLWAQDDSLNLTGFNGLAIPEGIALTWTTNGEYNVQHFSLERSLDAVNFEPIMIQKPHAHIVGEKEYVYKDKNIFREQVYYRLTTQFRTSQQQSKIIAVGRNDKLSLPNIMVYPTLTNQVVHVVNNSSEDMSGAAIYIFTISGNLLMKKNLDKGFLVESLDVSNYDVGMYIVEFRKKGLATQSKFIKQ